MNKKYKMTAVYAILAVLVVAGIAIYLQSLKRKQDNTSSEVNSSTQLSEVSTEISDAPVIMGTVIKGLEHTPTGLDNIYGNKEVKATLWERSPRDPIEGDSIILSAATWPTKGDYEVWISWELNGELQPTIACRHPLNDGEKAIWRGTLGSFEQGDYIKYSFHAGVEGTTELSTETFSFSVLGWETLTKIEKMNEFDGMIELIGGSSSTLKPRLYLSFPEDGTVRLQFEPLYDNKMNIVKHITNKTQKNNESENGIYASEKEDSQRNDISKATYKVVENENEIFVSNSEVSVRIGKEPFTFEVFSEKEELLFSDTKNGAGLRFLTDDNDIVKNIEFCYSSPKEEEFYGFGMKFDQLNHRGKNVDIYTVNWYTDQVGESYSPIPYYFVPNKYGMYVNSTYYSQFRMATDILEGCSMRLTTGGDVNTGMDLYLYFGNNNKIIKRYTNTVGKPVLPNVWAFGPWISANEWNRQSEVLDQINQSVALEIPTTVIVLEAWSDEETFYTFNDSIFEAKVGDYKPSYSDFTFRNKWPDPKGMVDYIHDNNMRILLWQIPVLKKSGSQTAQSILDQMYAEEQGYVLKLDNGDIYRMPDGWFGGSTLIDFTSEDATRWFLGKRQYLLDEVGIDGFKTDGGEFVWGRNVIASDGSKGDELRNAYPDLYAQAYFDFARKIVPDALTFSRAGGTFLGSHPIVWVGDQKSDYDSFQEAIRATLSLSMSGVPFVAWDIAGFSGDIPTSQLYQRSVAQAAFSPIMQVHSEQSGDPDKSAARTPWNMAERTGDEACLNVYRYYANLRMNLLPYLYKEAYTSSITGVPLMRSMAYAFPEEKEATNMEFQYLLGDSLLVAPVTVPDISEQEVYLPMGGWYDLFSGEYLDGGKTVVRSTKRDEIPVFVKSGSIIPMNLNNRHELGGNIGNSTDEYKQLCFRIYPDMLLDFCWYDFVNDKEHNILVDKVKDSRGMTINLDQIGELVTLEIYQKLPKEIIINGKIIKKYASNNFISQGKQGWWFDEKRGAVLISVDTKNPTNILLTKTSD